jgi:hypothetical protein
MNRKGVLSAYVFVFTFMAIGLALFLITQIGDDVVNALGRSQSELLDTYVGAEVDLFNDGRLIEYVWKDSLIGLGKTGGVDTSSIGEYSYWKRGGESCFPDLEELESKLAEIIVLKTEGDYVLDVDSSNVVITYDKEYVGGADNTSFTYYFNPVVEIGFDYDLNEFLDAIQTVEIIVSECGDDIACWDTKDVSYSVDDNNVFKVDVVSGIVKDILGEEVVIVKGAIDFDYNPLQDGEFEC